MSRKQSEFGKGLVTCLVKYAEHFERWPSIKDRYKGLGESHAVEMFFNGASDHLYEIYAPKTKEWAKIRVKVAELKQHGLEIGHGFTGKKYAEGEVFKAQKMLEEIAVMIDEVIGLKPDIGEW